MGAAPRLVLLSGATGQLGGYLRRELSRLGWPSVGWTNSPISPAVNMPLGQVDLAQKDLVTRAYRELKPSHILHAAALTSVAACAHEPERAFQINAEAIRLLAELAGQTKARLLLISTDLVFNGKRGKYQEIDSPSPLSVYGRTKVEAEKAVQSVSRAVVVRVSLLFGPSIVGRPYFFDDQVRALREGKSMTLFRDEWRSPLHLAVAARALLDILASDYEGILHVGGPERMSRLEMGQRLAKHLSVANPVIEIQSRESLPGEPRPRDTSLDSSLWRKLFPNAAWPNFEEALCAI